MKKDNPLCPFCTVDKTCFRHQEKGAVKPKKSYAIPKQAKGKESKFKDDKERKERLTKFYDEMLNAAPFYCQDCGVHLSGSIQINPRAIVCHILEKRNYPSVECNANNIVYLCNVHHSRLDGNLQKYLLESPIAPLIKERVQLLLPLLTETELSKVSPYFLK